MNHGVPPTPAGPEPPPCDTILTLTAFTYTTTSQQVIFSAGAAHDWQRLLGTILWLAAPAG